MSTSSADHYQLLNPDYLLLEDQPLTKSVYDMANIRDSLDNTTPMTLKMLNSGGDESLEDFLIIDGHRLEQYHLCGRVKRFTETTGKFNLVLDDGTAITKKTIVQCQFTFVMQIQK